MESKYLDFVEIPAPSRKTDVYAIRSKSGADLGQIKWHANWRKYCFFPLDRTIFDAKCLTDITDFITHLMMLRETKG